ncbi:SDR family oxidoreductase [Nakamurella lactea]|uniref:SDR family oxidoreductase n=1 Tax=Nakamurella lactea TaxID=459515 RepID=UPI000414C67F|nr:NAD(P)H-binding protein [Nakamurella lactea]
MSTPILLTGGTGTLGGHVLPLLRAAGHPVRVLSRQPHDSADGVEYVSGDLRTDQGIDAAVGGVHTVLHLAGGPKGDAEATAHLVRAARAAGVEHLVYISVIGADRVPVGWLQSKLAAEQAIAGSGIGWTTMRAAQFHDLVFKTVTTMAKLPVFPIPGGLRFEPVDARDVAARLVDLTLQSPAGLVSDLAGPRVYDMAELADTFLRASGKHRLRPPVRIPGKAGRAYRAGDNLADLRADRGARSWEDFLAGKFAHAAAQPARS